MVQRTYDELQEVVLKHNLLFATNKMFGNYIWVRESNEITNKFNDTLHIAYLDEEGQKQVINVPVTTKAGIKGAFDAPPTVAGITGTAVIVFPQQCINTWQFLSGTLLSSLNKGYPFNFPFFQQILPIKYWRDNLTEEIKNGSQLEIIEENLQTGVFGTQWHVMSNPPPAAQSGNVNNWSEGCMGAQYNDWLKVIEFADKSCAIWGNKVSGVLLKAESFE